MKRMDKAWFGGLLCAAAWIWLRNRAWISTADEVLPILGALPLYVWLGMPWHFQNAPFSVRPVALVTAVALLLGGVVFDLTLLLAGAWTAALWAWLGARLEREGLLRAQRLLVIPFMAFPWIALDGASLSWYFRLSAAAVTSWFYQVAGFNVAREGVHLMVQSTPISVDASCSGLNTLQSMLIAGTLIVWLQLGASRRYWWSLPVLVGVAWLANTLRVILLIAAALTFSPDFARGWFHMWGGWSVLVLMFVLCWFLFGLVADKQPAKPPS